jgi:hypothetical protein
MTALDEVMERIRGAYGSLDEPRFDFVVDAARDPRYRTLIRNLAERYTLDADTDLNSDVSFGCVLRYGAERWVLRVSMVGPYAMLLRLRGQGGATLVSSPDPSSSEAEQELIGAVEDSGLRLLDRTVLAAPVNLRLFNTAPNRTRVYQALFVDTDFLPWER